MFSQSSVLLLIEQSLADQYSIKTSSEKMQNIESVKRTHEFDRMKLLTMEFPKVVVVVTEEQLGRGVTIKLHFVEKKWDSTNQKAKFILHNKVEPLG